MCGRDRQKSTTWFPEILSRLCQGSHQVYPLTDPSSSKSQPFTCPLLCFLTLTSYFHHVCHPRPLPDLWALKLLEHPFILLLQLLCGPDMLNPYSPTRSAKRQKSGPQTSLYSHGLTEAWHTGQLINIFQVDGWLLLEFLALPTCCWH